VSPDFRFGPGSIAELQEVAGELELKRLLLVTTRRGAALASRLPVAAVFADVRSHTPPETVAAAFDLAFREGVDGLVGLGGGSAIDTCKAVTVAMLERDREVRTIAVPTTYAGAEWTPFFGMRDGPKRAKVGGSHPAARPVAAIYDPELTLSLPRAETGGTAMNALAHCVEALYVKGRTERGDRHAFCGARAISYALPLVLADGASVYARTRLLEGAMRAARALAEAGLGLGHAMAQALGARYGLPHGALNAICLPAALRFNSEAAAGAMAQLAEAMVVEDPIAHVEELAVLAGLTRLCDLGVPKEELDLVAAQAAVRPGTKANPLPADAEQIATLLHSVW
jgi:maleylacetate reductase